MTSFTGDALDQANARPLYRSLPWITGMGAFLDVYTIASLGASVFSVVPSLHISSTTFALIAVLVQLGALVGALILGRITDAYGRRLIFLLDMVLFIIFALLSAISTNVTELAVFRFLTGLAIGADFAPALSLLAEYSPKKIRGSMMAKFFIFFGAGGMVAEILGAILFHYFGTAPIQWRLMMVSAVVPAGIGLVARISLAESPRWLEAQGRSVEAADALKKSVGVSLDANKLAGEKKISFGNAFLTKGTLFIVLPLAFVMLLSVPGEGSLTAFGPVIFGTLGIQRFYTLIYTGLLFFGGQAIGGGIGAVMSDRVGRVRSYMTASIVMIVFAFLLYFFGTHVYATLALVFIFAVASFIWNAIVYPWPVELFPVQTRGTGEGINIAMNRLGLVLGTEITPFILPVYKLEGLFAIFGVLLIVGTLIGFFTLRRTGAVEGKSLEEIAVGNQ